MTLIAWTAVALVFVALLGLAAWDLNRAARAAVVARDRHELAAAASRARGLHASDVAGGVGATVVMTAIGMTDPMRSSLTAWVAVGIALGVVWALNTLWARRRAVSRIVAARTAGAATGARPAGGEPAAGREREVTAAGETAVEESPPAAPPAPPAPAVPAAADRRLGPPGRLIVAVALAIAAGVALETVRQGVLPWYVAVPALVVFAAFAGLSGAGVRGARRAGGSSRGR